MIILGILAVCINAQSYGDLVKLFVLFHFPVTVMLQFWSWKKKKKEKPFCLWISIQQAKFWILRNWAKNCCFCSCAQMSSLKKGILHIWNYKWTGFFPLQGILFENPRGKFTCCFNNTYLCFALRARSVDTSLSFLMKGNT